MFNVKSMLSMISDEYQAFFQKRQEWRESLWEMEGLCYPWTSENGCKNFEMWSHCNFLSYAFPLFIDRILKIKIIDTVSFGGLDWSVFTQDHKLCDFSHLHG